MTIQLRFLGAGLWTPSDLIRARVRERDRARPNPSCFVFYQHYSDYAIIFSVSTVFLHLLTMG